MISEDPVQFMRLDRQYAEIGQEIEAAVAEVFSSGAVLQSKHVTQLENRIAALHNHSYAIAVNSGTDSLAFALMALDLPKGSPIAVTAFSFVASASAIVHAGHRPVFVDVDPTTLLMDEPSVLELINARSIAAIVVVHLYGQIAPLETVSAAARAAGIPIVEDSAQALGCTRKGLPPGGYGVASSISFDPTKVIGAFGSGGIVSTNSESIAQRIRLLRYHGHSGNNQYSIIGYNSQMDSVQAAIINVKLNHADEWQKRRQAIARLVTEAVSDLPVQQVSLLPGNTHNYHKFVWRSEHRDKILGALSKAGINARVHYPYPLHLQPCFQGLTSDSPSLPVAEKASREVFSLPIYAELTESEVERIISGFRSALRQE